jgi:hypothetical protein
MKSSWDQTQARSNYHFDARRVDQLSDVLTLLGQVDVTWSGDLNDIIARSQPATWETRGYKAEGIDIPRPDLAAEEYDLQRVGADPKMTITNLDWTLPSSLQQLTDDFALADCMNRIHVQMPGQVWNLHIDKLNKWCPEDPGQVMRIFVQLTDWQPGQFWEYGNYHWHQWRAGDVSTFDWANIPHSTANAGHHPRVTFQITGVRTKKTESFLKEISCRNVF